MFCFCFAFIFARFLPVGISPCGHLSTPLGPLSVSLPLLSSLSSSIAAAGVPVQTITVDADSKEHSGEMQYPFIRHLLTATSSTSVKIVPLMVGRSSPGLSAALSPYIISPSAFTVVSTDFCHWGERFSYAPFSPPPPDVTLGEAIARLDGEGMSAVEALCTGGFCRYLERTGNTICGREPVKAFMGAQKGGEGGRFEWLRYERSGEVRDRRDSSVGYAGGIFY